MAASNAWFGTQGGIADLGGTGLTASGVSGAVNGLAGAFGAFQQSAAYNDEAKQYNHAGDVDMGQAVLAGEVEKLQAFQLNRKVALTESAQQSAAAANGLSESGSAAALLRESTQQGNEASGNLLFNTSEKQQQLEEQASSAYAQAKAARSASSGSIVGGILKGVSGIASIAGML